MGYLPDGFRREENIQEETSDIINS